MTSNENSVINQTDINKANEKHASRCPGISETAVRDLAKRMSRFYEMRNMPAPMPEPAHPAHPLAADIRSEQRAKSVPPKPHRLVANIYAALVQQILDVSQ